MKIQVLASVMNQQGDSIIKKMKLASDAIIINQCGVFSEKKIKSVYGTIIWINTAERGAALSRNTALQRSNADVAVFADDDIIYRDDYVKIIEEEFECHPEADIILFNVPSLNPDRPNPQISSWGRVRLWNGLKYGTFNIAFRVNRVRKKCISFNQYFGGGAQFGSGEDTLFIVESLKKGLKIYKSPKIIAVGKQESSTWFSGFNEKYFLDKGALFEAICGRCSFFLYLQYLFRHNEEYAGKYSKKQVLDIMKRGRAYWREI